MKKTTILKLALCFSLTSMMQNVLAGDVESVVTSVQSTINNNANARSYVTIGFADLPTGRPACATDPLGRMAIPESGGRYLIELAIISMTEGRSLRVGGTGECIGSLEIVRFVILK